MIVVGVLATTGKSGEVLGLKFGPETVETVTRQPAGLAVRNWKAKMVAPF